MNPIYLSIFLCMLAVFAQADKVDDTNKLVDGILENVLKSKELNPLRFHQDYEEDIVENVFGVKLSGRMKISKGVVYGLHGLKRSGNCKLISKDGVMNISITLSDTNVALDADISGHLGHLPSIPAVPIVATVGELKIDTKLQITNDMHVLLKKFKVDDISQVKLRLKDAAHIKLVEDIIDTLSDIVVYIFNAQIRDAVEQAVIPILENELRYIHL